MRVLLGLMLTFPFALGCGGKDGDSGTESEECFSDDDCPDGQMCVITHDHEGDDHDHGGACETSE